MATFIGNLRHALRQLRHAPGFTATVLLTLALGIGATTAIFSIVEAVLLRPLPFRNSDRLVLLGDHVGRSTGISVTAREIATYSTAAQAFSSMGGFITTSYELSGSEQPEEVNAARITASMFATVGVQPIIGRIFSPEEENASQPLTVISYALWLNRYHRDPQVLGTSIVLDRKTYSIIGVMPRDFTFPFGTGRLEQTQLWVPLSLSPAALGDDQAGYWGYRIIARLKDGVTLPQAAQDADRVAQQTMHNFPASMAAIHIRGDVESLRENAVGEIRPLLHTLFFAVSIVLLIACANVAGLLLVRAIRRRREYAVRLSLGAGYGAVLRESILEGLLLSLSGGLLGLALAAVAMRTTLRLLPESMPRIDSISVNFTVAAFAVLVALATGTLCSLAPAFVALRTNVAESLKQGAGTITGAASHAWLRSTLAVAEIATALVLLTASGAFLLSFQKMRAVDPGFRPDHVLVANYQLPLSQYPTDSFSNLFHHALIDRLLSKPGIVAAGITDSLPATDFVPKAAYTIEGVSAENWKLKFAAFAITYGDYFEAMRIPLLDGRTFNAHDRADAPLVVIVNETMAKDCWPGQSAIGKRMHVGNPKKGLPWATVVGVVADTKMGSRDEPSEGQWYLPLEQPAILFGPQPSEKLSRPAGGYITVRSALPPEQMTQTLRSTIAEIDPLLALSEVQPMNDVMAQVEAPRRFNTDLITAFAAGALLLAVLGIYAVVAFSVSQRTQEIAIRMALGAQRGGIARLVLVSGAKLALLGCVIGIFGSLAVSKVISSFLFGVSATDPLVYSAGVLVMMLMALLASALPAVRAASADPIEALRSV
jgi:putative ABC transport system permease protein